MTWIDKLTTEEWQWIKVIAAEMQAKREEAK